MKNDVKKISPLRLALWEIDKLISENDANMQALLRSKNLTPEELENLYQIRYGLLAAQARVRNLAELYEHDDISSLRFAAYKAEEYLTAVVNRINTLFENKGIEITLECSQDCGNVMLDLRRTNLILYNLISNAIIHSRIKDKRITVGASMRGTDFIISVTDNGRKIAAAKQKQMFFAYESIVVKGQELADPFKLRGIGLSVSRMAAREMNGEVTYLQSAPHNVFEVLIPQAQHGRICEPSAFVLDKDELESCMASAILAFCLCPVPLSLPR